MDKTMYDHMFRDAEERISEMFKDGCSFLLKEANDALNSVMEKTVYCTEKLEESVNHILLDMKMSMAQQILDRNNNFDNSTSYTISEPEKSPRIKCESPDLYSVSLKQIEIPSCDECGKTYAKKASLKKHIKNVHVGIKNLKCQLCDYITSEKSNLDKHIEGRHPTFTDQTCHLCGFKVFREINIKRHYESVHNLIRIKKIYTNSEGKKCIEIFYESSAGLKSPLATKYQTIPRHQIIDK